MEQKDKELLFKDLSARLPYGVGCLIGHNGEHLDTIIAADSISHAVFTEVGNRWFGLDFIKPYLRPLSSITKEDLYWITNLLNKVSYKSKEEAINVALLYVLKNYEPKKE